MNNVTVNGLSIPMNTKVQVWSRTGLVNSSLNYGTGIIIGSDNSRFGVMLDNPFSPLFVGKPAYFNAHEIMFLDAPEIMALFGMELNCSVTWDDDEGKSHTGTLVNAFRDGVPDANMNLEKFVVHELYNTRDVVILTRRMITSVSLAKWTVK